MSERYDENAAAHYSAYRPPLHQAILEKVLGRAAQFEYGVDVGSGTGYSAIALAKYCARVYGIEPSPMMLSKAAPHERVIYMSGAAEHIPLKDDSVDIVTFAGSLYYADRVATVEEVKRVCRSGAVAVVYDFEILLGALIETSEAVTPADNSRYDHAVNLSDNPALKVLLIGKERMTFALSGSELAHVLLSDSNRFDRLARELHTDDPFPPLAERFEANAGRPTLEADIYYSKYSVLT